MLVWSLPISLLVLILQRAMSGQVQGHFKEDAYITSGMNRIHMNKLYLSLGKHYPPLMKIT
uniref:Uncharacterized protein n=1 Tax=Lotus japonicus TaxID=34305 RepID=I3S0M7_LOTJA|nr:unknown [Lotus japonicus]